MSKDEESTDTRQVSGWLIIGRQRSLVCPPPCLRLAGFAGIAFGRLHRGLAHVRDSVVPDSGRRARLVFLPTDRR